MSSERAEEVSIKLMPGSKFPEIHLTTDDGFPVTLSASGSYKLVLVYRGAFCSFCECKFFDKVLKRYFSLTTFAFVCSDAPGNQPRFRQIRGVQH